MTMGAKEPAAARKTGPSAHDAQNPREYFLALHALWSRGAPWMVGASRAPVHASDYFSLEAPNICPNVSDHLEKHNTCMRI